MLDSSVTCGETSGECVITSSGASTSSSSSSGALAGLNSNFTGVWKAELPKPHKATSSSSSGNNVEAQVTSSSSGGKDEHPEGPKGSRIITFKLCIKDGSLVGSTVEQGGVLNMGIITSQTIISPDEVSVNIEGNKGAKATIDLKLTNEREFAGTFADGHTFKARKLNPFHACLAPGVGPSMGDMGNGMAGQAMGEDHGMNGGPNMGEGPMDGPPAMDSMGIGPSMGDQPIMDSMGAGPFMGGIPPIMGSMGGPSMGDNGSSSGSDENSSDTNNNDNSPDDSDNNSSSSSSSTSTSSSSSGGSSGSVAG